MNQCANYSLWEDTDNTFFLKRTMPCGKDSCEAESNILDKNPLSDPLAELI